MQKNLCFCDNIGFWDAGLYFFMNCFIRYSFICITKNNCVVIRKLILYLENINIFLSLLKSYFRLCKNWFTGNENWLTLTSAKYTTLGRQFLAHHQAQYFLPQQQTQPRSLVPLQNNETFLCIQFTCQQLKLFWDSGNDCLHYCVVKAVLQFRTNVCRMLVVVQIHLVLVSLSLMPSN